jgi:heme exporter protein B
MQRFLSFVWILVRKDFRIELRTKEVLVVTLFFSSLVSLVAGISFYSGALATSAFAPGAMWLPLAFAAVLATARVWQRERENEALSGILLSAAPRTAIYVAKVTLLVAFLLVVALLVVPLAALFFHIDLLVSGGQLAAMAVMVSLGAAAISALFGAMTVRTGARDLMLSAVLFPLLAPLIMTAVTATRELLLTAESGHVPGWSDLRDYFLLLGVFDFVALALGAGLFGLLVEDA